MTLIGGHAMTLQRMPGKSKFAFSHAQTNPKQFWTERLQRVFVNTEPVKHSGDVVRNDFAEVLNNIAAAAHACNINKTRWIHDCFASTDDCIQFLDCLYEFKRHINSYWFYALIDIAEVAEDQASNSRLLATCLYEQAVRTKQLEGGTPRFRRPIFVDDFRTPGTGDGLS